MRDVNTYRSNRRNAWRLTRKFVSFAPNPSWATWNAYMHGSAGYGIYQRGSGEISSHVARSKYTPHIGKKQREKRMRA